MIQTNKIKTYVNIRRFPILGKTDQNFPYASPLSLTGKCVNHYTNGYV